MDRWQVQRLAILSDDVNGRIAAIRTRPTGFPLTLREPEGLFENTRSLTRARATTARGFVEHGGSKLGPLDLLSITSDWVDSEGSVIRRVCRTPARTFVERVEFLEFAYAIDARPNAIIPLLQFSTILGVDPVADGVLIRTFPYGFNVRSETAGEAAVSLIDIEGHQILAVEATGKIAVRVMIAVTCLERQTGDASTYILPGLLDDVAFHTIALAPSLLANPLSRNPMNALLRPGAAFLYPGPIVAQPTGLASFVKFLGVKPKPARVADAPAQFPFSAKIRMSQALVIWSGAPIVGVSALVDEMRSLPAGKLSSLQRVLILTTTDDAEAFARQEIAEIGRVAMTRIEPVTTELVIESVRIPAGPGAVETALAAIETRLDAVEWGGPIRSRHEAAGMVKSPLPPLRIPQTEDPSLLAPYLVAARLRQSPVRAGVVAETWPLPAESTSVTAAAVSVAEYLLADIAIHESERDARSDAAYEDVFAAAVHEIRSGRMRADRMTLAVTTGDHPVPDRVKLLPAILYAAHVHGPLLPVRISAAAQASIIEAWTVLTTEIEELYLQLAKANFAEMREWAPRVDGSQQRFSEAIGALVPPQYLDLIRRVRPKEIVNFSALPLEWVHVDGIPLGYLTKVTNVRSKTLATETGMAADLSSAYTSLVTPDLRPSAETFRVLLLAPRYSGAAEEKVNEFSRKEAAVLRQHLQHEIDLGREIEVVAPEQISRSGLQELLRETWSLFIYVGHAAVGELEFDGFSIGANEFPETVLIGSTVFLIGCDTNGVRNLAGSVASEFLRLGARGVFATTYVLPIVLATNLCKHLAHYALQLNMQFGDVMTGVRHATFLDHLDRFYGARLERGVREDFEILSPFDSDLAGYRDSWSALYEASKTFFASDAAAAEAFSAIAPNALYSGLALTFAGDIRGRLFEF